MPNITGYIEKDAETGLYVAIVPGIPGAHTQAKLWMSFEKISKKQSNCALLTTTTIISKSYRGVKDS
jgi:hypothetical protein